MTTDSPHSTGPVTPVDLDPDQRPEPSDDAYDLDRLIDATLEPMEGPDDETSATIYGRPEIPRKTENDLEWDKVLELVASKTVTPEGAEVVPDLLPLPDRGAVERRLHEVRECMEMLADEDRPPLRGRHDIRKALAHVKREGTLVADDLEAIGRNCDVASRCERFFETRSDRQPYLHAVAEGLDPCDELREALNHAIEPGGRLSDQASPDLARLRRRVQNQHDRLKARIDRMLKSRELEDHLQEDYYTVRENRYVLPVRTGSKSQVPGIVHGYSSSGQTAFIEPEELVDINNELRWAEIELEEEKQRIFERLSGLVADHVESLERNVRLSTYLDVVTASAKFGYEIVDGAIPKISDRKMTLQELKHPLLWVQHEREVDGETVNDTVTNDVHFDPDRRVLVVSGPNTGGKTVLLKAMGLSALMARCGLPVPADHGSEVPLYDEIFSDIGDDQSIERDLSTFSAHLTNINGFLDDCGSDSLVLLDELFTGTDPLEGSALATALLEELSERGATTIVTTHLEGLKTLALQDDTFANASMGFDLDDLEPTFRLTMGVPGSSFAIRIADRLGFPERLVERAQGVLEGEDHREVDEVIASLEDRMSDIERERERMEDARRKAERAEEKFRDKYDSLLEKEREMVHDETRKLKEQLVEVREQIRDKIHELQNAERVEDLEQRDLHAMQEELSGAEETIEEASDKARPPEPGPAGLVHVPDDELEEDMEVYVHSYEREGTVIQYDEGDDEAVVQIGALKVETELDDLFYPSEEERRSHVRGRSGSSSRGGSSGGGASSSGGATGEISIPRTDANTLDLRGSRVHEVNERLDGFLDSKFLESFNGVIVIHGHGTGALKRAVRGHLAESPYVDDFRPGEQDEGGDGVTIARFVDEIER